MCAIYCCQKPSTHYGNQVMVELCTPVVTSLVQWVSHWTLQQYTSFYTDSMCPSILEAYIGNTVVLSKYIVPSRMHSYRNTALSEISNRIVGKNITSHRLISRYIFFRCGVYKYCCLVYGTVWCGDTVQSANSARIMFKVCMSRVDEVSMLVNT